MIGRGKKPDEAEGLLEKLTSTGARSPALMRAALELRRGQRQAGAPVRSLPQGKASEFIAALRSEAVPLATSNGPLDDRVVAIRFLGTFDAASARETLPALLDARQPSAVQLAVLQTLSSIAGGVVPGQIIAQWRSMSPSVRREAVEVLFSRTQNIEAMLAAVESRAILPSEIDPARWNSLQTHASPDVRRRAQAYLGRQGAASRDRGQVLAAYRPAIELAGDRDRGRDLFARTCATCHQAEGRGTDVGPNLATVAGRSPEELLVHILDPNREVAPNFVNYNVATEGGRVISGIIAEESAAALVLRRAEGAQRRGPEGTDRSGRFHRRKFDARRAREGADGSGLRRLDRVRPHDPAGGADGASAGGVEIVRRQYSPALPDDHALARAGWAAPPWPGSRKNKAGRRVRP